MRSYGVYGKDSYVLLIKFSLLNHIGRARKRGVVGQEAEAGVGMSMDFEGKPIHKHFIIIIRSSLGLNKN